jgi:iron complex transport system ATP-binding protein
MTYAARDISVRVGSATLLVDVSMELRPGEIVVLLGPNGAGKSTFISALAGDRRPTSGTITLDDRPLAEYAPAELARRRAVMSTDHAVAFSFTSVEIAMLGRLPFHGGTPTDGDARIVDQLMAAVDCSTIAARVYMTLSSGERQRVELARALAQVAPAAEDGSADRYLLLDEPTSSLDPAHQHMAMQLLRQRADAGLGILAVVHDLNLAAAYADRVVLMHEARIVAEGHPAEVLRAPMLESVFDIPMLVIPHPQLSHPLVVPGGSRHGRERRSAQTIA